jgi:hypothetical protein
VAQEDTKGKNKTVEAIVTISSEAGPTNKDRSP